MISVSPYVPAIVRLKELHRALSFVLNVAIPT